MLVKSNDTDIQRVVEYIDEGKYECFYLYADMLEYGTKGKGFGLWTSEGDGRIQGVAYRYHDTLHIYSHDLFPSNDALELIGEFSPKCVMGPLASVEKLIDKTDNTYKMETSYIVTRKQPFGYKQRIQIEIATENDVAEVAMIMMEDEVYNSVYTYDRLYKELIERIKSGFGKIYIIRDKKGNILASQATYAETNDMVVISGLVTSGRVRGLGFGPMLTTSVLDLNYKENKRVLAFINVDNIESVTMHKRLGYDFLGLYARLIKE